MPSEPERRRVFFALDPPAGVRRALARAGRALGWPGRAISDERLHLTLVFVGDATAGDIEALLAHGEATPLPPMDLVIDRGGAFPRARVGWLGSEAPPAALLAFREALFGRLDVAGLHRDRRAWTPHVTVYRDLRSRPATVSIEPVEWPVRRFALMVSRPVPGGVRYEALHRWNSVAPGKAPEGA